MGAGSKNDAPHRLKQSDNNAATKITRIEKSAWLNILSLIKGQVVGRHAEYALKIFRSKATFQRVTLLNQKGVLRIIKALMNYDE